MEIVFDNVWLVASILAGVAAIASAGHALLHKTDPRSQLVWMVLVLALPVLGILLYLVLGINRIQTRSKRLHEKGRFQSGRSLPTGKVSDETPIGRWPEHKDFLKQQLAAARTITRIPLTQGNSVEILHDGEEAYPAMLAAIEESRSYVFLCSYIFETDSVGKKFAEALCRAADRGVDVRVLIDGVGGLNGHGVRRQLRKHPGIAVANFMPLEFSWRMFGINLRNHRKLLIVDGHTAFTGGINISARHLVQESSNRNKTRDMHFRLQGPVTCSLEQVFSEDWCFKVGATDWPDVVPPQVCGQAMCRPIKDGPNEDYEKLQWILVGAISSAKRCVRIITPYFLPERDLLVALRVAVLHGANVQVVIPRKSNIFLVDWATRALLIEVLRYGVEVYWQEGPFDHSKMLVIDDLYVNIGSANLDPRSLRLNFELNVEVYDPELAAKLVAHHQSLVARSERVTTSTLRKTPFPARIRNGAANLLSRFL